MIALLKQLKLFNRISHIVGLLSIIFMIAALSSAVNANAAPPSGEGTEDDSTLVDVIENGDFEKPWEFMNGVAPNWEPYSNGRAAFGWYEETWAEAVRKGQGHAQLMEIFEVEANVLDRVIAIHQTVDVAPNAEYELTIHAIMRSNAAAPYRNKYEYEMHWGVDPWGEGNYDNVEDWIPIPLTEQFRIGSNAPYPEDIPLFYERITDTLRTGENTNRITLFIRGLKKFPNGTEVNFDVDDVSLIGPPPDAVLPAALSPEVPAETSEDVTTAPAEDANAMPTTGATLSFGASIGTFVIGGLVLLILATAATFRLLEEKRIT